MFRAAVLAALVTITGSAPAWSRGMDAATVTCAPLHGVYEEAGPQARLPRATAVVAPFRCNDILWENDRTAHRIYSRILETREPPSGSGIDAWGKRVRWPFMARQILAGQHDDHGEGVDFYNVGTSRGVGGLGVWFDNKLWVSRNYTAARVLKNGPDSAVFEVDYAPWPVDVTRNVSETRRFSLSMGTNFTRLVSTIRSSDAAPLVIGIGIAKRPNGQGQAAMTMDRARGAMTVWGPDVRDHGAMGVAVLVDPRSIADITEDADNYLVLVNVTPGRPFVYYAGAAWSGGLDIHTQADWARYVAAQTPDFDASHP